MSGAHFNPAVTLAFTVQGAITPRLALGYVAVQVLGAVAGTLAAHLMFELAPIQISEIVRTGFAQWWAEITAAYWFTASTSFANPAVAIGRAFTDTFSGIRPLDLPGFIAAEFIGALIAVALFSWLLHPKGGPRRAMATASADEKPPWRVVRSSLSHSKSIFVTVR